MIARNSRDQKCLKVLAVNVHGIECVGRLDQIQILLEKHQISVAILTETETSHSVGQTTHIEGFQAFCPPPCVIGPYKKEVGVILLMSKEQSSDSKPRPDLNGNDSVQTIWIELKKYNLIIGGVY